MLPVKSPPKVLNIIFVISHVILGPCTMFVTDFLTPGTIPIIFEDPLTSTGTFLLMTLPYLFMLMLSFSPFSAFATSALKSLKLSSFLPFTASISSPFNILPAAAGVSFIVLSTFIVGMPVMATTENNIIAMSMFTKAPATKILNLFPGLALQKALLSVLSSSSPSMAQNPPIGKSLIEYSVSPPSFLYIAGPIPNENSFTLTPDVLAAIKCPSSCGNTKMKNSTNTYITVI